MEKHAPVRTGTPAPSEEAAGVKGRVALTYAVFVLVGVGAGVGGVALPAQIADYGVDQAAIGLTFFAFSAGFMAAGLTSGHLIRRLGIRNSLILAGAVYVLASLVTAARPSFIWFVLIGIPSGYGTGVLESVLNTYLAGLPKPGVRLGRLHAFFGVGALIGPILAARLLLDFSWTAIWVVLAVTATPLTVGFAVLLHRDGEPESSSGTEATVGSVEESGTRESGTRESGTGESGTGGAAASGPVGRGLLASTVRQPAVLAGGLMLATYVGLEVSVGNWAFSFLVDDRGQEALGAGNMVSGYWLGLTIGRFVIGPVAARLAWADARTTTVTLVGVVLATLAVWFAPSTAVLAGALVLVGFFLGPVFPNIMAAAPRLTDAARVPTAIGFLNGVSVLGGSALPWVAGVLIQEIGLWTLLPYAAALAAVQLVIWSLLARRLADSHPA